MNLSLNLLRFFFFLLLVSCTSSEKEDIPTRGEITFTADESLKPIVEAQKMAFEGTYKYAKLNVVYLPEQMAVQRLLNDSARLTIITRELDSNEQKQFENEKIIYRKIKLATDGLALITHKKNPISHIKLEELHALFSGKINSWAQVKGGSGGKIILFFDNQNSSNLRLVLEKIGKLNVKIIPYQIAGSHEKLIELVSQTPNSLGFLGMSWISDLDDDRHRSALSKISVLGVSENNSEYFYPFQEGIYNKKYPFSRDIWLILKEARMGLGNGFTSFMANDKGQRIFLKSGLLPNYNLLREVNVKH